MVSIPLWSDYKEQGLDELRDAFPRFNSTLVRLEVQDIGGEWILHFGFNSTLVRLEADVVNLKRVCPGVSIPLWSDYKGPGLRTFS